jgi:hypothetical protein
LRKLVINPQFDQAGDFNHELAPVWLGGRQGYIDKGGKYVWPSKYQAAKIVRVENTGSGRLSGIHIDQFASTTIPTTSN